MSTGPRWARWAIFWGALLGALGWWLPWLVPESGAAALVLLGLDFGDFWKFTREWRLPAVGGLGLFEMERVTFFLPPALAAIVLTLWMAGQRGRGRWLLIPLLLFLSVVILPAYRDVQAAFTSTPFRYQDANLAREFSFQLYLATFSLLTVLFIPLWQRLNDRLRHLLIALVALLAAVLPAWALWRTWLVLEGLYGGGALVGPGVIISSLGFVLVTLAASISALTQRAKRRSSDLRARIRGRPIAER